MPVPVKALRSGFVNLFGPSLVWADFRGRRYTRATVHRWLFGVFHRREAVAAHDKIHLPAEVSIVAEVAIGAMVGTPGAFGVSVDMAISIPGRDRDADDVLVAKRTRYARTPTAPAATST